MKKITKIIAILCLLLINITINTKAASNQIILSGTTTIQPGSQFSITVKITNVTNFLGTRSAIEYDSSAFRLDSLKSTYISGTTPASYINLSTGSPLSGTVTLATLTFTATGISAGSSSTIRVNPLDVTYKDSSGNTNETSGSAGSIKITAVAPKSSNNNLSSLKVDGTSVSGFSASKTSYNLGSTDKSSVSVAATSQDARATIRGDGYTKLAYGSNTIRVVVKAENGSSKTYSITINKNDNRSSNNFLSSIELSYGEIQFDKNRNNYTLIVDNDVTKLSVDVVKEDAKATIKNTSLTKELDIYSNIFEFSVVAENNSERVYSINVVRRDADGYAGSLNTNNNLESLSVEGYEFEFNPETLEYELQVEHAVSTLSVNAVVADETASLVLPDSFDLELGENIFDLTVIAQDETQKVYQLRVMRARNLAPLPIDELIPQLDTIEADILNVALVSNSLIDEAMLTKLKTTSKDVAFHVLDENNLSIGYWKLTSDQLSVINTFNPTFRYLSKVPQSLNELLNYAQSLVLTFDHEGEFDQPIKFVLPLQGSMDESYMMNVYYYNEETGKLESVARDLEIVNDEVMWEMNHASIYVITPAILSSSFSFDSMFTNSGILLIGALVLLTLSLLGNLMLLLKVKKLRERLFARNFDSKNKNKENTIEKKIVAQNIETNKNSDSTIKPMDQNKKENT